MKNHLFIIGIDQYKDHDNLNSCVKDVSDFKSILIEKFQFEEPEVYELLNQEATNKKIQDALQGYSKRLSDRDNLVIFYSGHGDIINERGFWVPHDASKDYTTWLPNETIITLLGAIRAKHIFLISDSCFSNSILVANGKKSTSQYFELKSRWGLASAFNESRDSSEGENTLFGEYILTFLGKSVSDFKVSDLIQYVKDQYDVNVLQKPQGAPLMLGSHKGGEFVFKLKEGSSIETSKRLKGFKNFGITLKHYKQNSRFELMRVEEIPSQKIGFELYREEDVVQKKITYYLYLYQGIYQRNTHKYLKENFPDVFKDKKLLIFLPKEEDQKNYDIRKNNIQKLFSPLNIFYVDEFIRDLCTPKLIEDDVDDSYLNISNFVLPSYSLETENQNIDIDTYIEEWFYKNNSPILVIKGTGGIGKTTFAQYIADKTKSYNPQSSVLFVDSVRVKDSILKRKNNHLPVTTYTFYEALHDISSVVTMINEELFKLNLDAGNIILIIDGLDEVISKIPNFNVDSFIESINNMTEDIGSGKIIITCRTYFWDTVRLTSESLNVIELLPFNEQQVELFFEKSFGNELPKKRKGIKLAQEFKYPGEPGDYIYHPYVLDIIRSIIRSDNETIDVDLSEGNSIFLNRNVKTDYIIFRICDRERKRIGQILTDDQIRFFVYFAVEKRGIIHTDDLNDILNHSLQKNIDKTNAESFKAHPFLINSDRTTKFKYDFLADFFKSIYMANFFSEKGISLDLSQSFLNILIENCRSGAGLIIDIANRVLRWDEIDIMQVSDMVDKISVLDMEVESKRKAIANIFNVSLYINHKFKSNDISSNTFLLKELFGKGNSGIIEKLCIINLNNTERKIRFDFSNLTFERCYFNNYDSFWDCKFNENTKFIESHLLNLASDKPIEIKDKAIFLNCIKDDQIDKLLQLSEIGINNKTENAKQFISDFFHLFYSNGRLGRQWEEQVIKPRFKGVNKPNYEYKKVIRVMKNTNILIVYEEKEGKKFAINDKFKEDVIKNVKDGTISPVISNLIRELNN